MCESVYKKLSPIRYTALTNGRSVNPQHLSIIHNITTSVQYYAQLKTYSSKESRDA